MRNRQPLTSRTQGLDLPRTIDVFKLLILTYPRYIDSASRAAVVGVLKTMVQRDEERGRISGEPHIVKMGLFYLQCLFVIILILP
jgi:hypothetical protein